MLRRAQTTTITTMCVIVFAHMTYDIWRYSKWRRKYWRSTKKSQKKSPLKPQDTQAYELRSANQ